MDGDTIDVAKAILPKKARVGDAIIIEDDGTLRIDKETTKKLRKEIDPFPFV